MYLSIATTMLVRLAFAVTIVLSVMTLGACGWLENDATPTVEPGDESTATEPPGQDPPADPSPEPEPTETPEPTATPSPEPVAEDMVTIHGLETSELIISLTFDAGADRGYTTEILDTLEAEGIKASFGMTGVWAQDNPDLITRIHEDGHHLINHTYDHPSLTGFSTESSPLTSEERIGQLRRTEEVIESILGEDAMRPYFRPPYGDYDDGVLTDIASAGYTVNVMWTVDSLGWQGLSAAEIAERCVSGATPGGILLFHVGAQSQDAAALPEIISRLREEGYRFVTVEEMVGR